MQKFIQKIKKLSKRKLFVAVFILIVIGAVFFSSCGAFATWILLKDKVADSKTEEESEQIEDESSEEEDQQVEDIEEVDASEKVCSEIYFANLSVENISSTSLIIERDENDLCRIVYKETLFLDSNKETIKELFYSIGEYDEDYPIGDYNYPFIQYNDTILYSGAKKILLLDQDGKEIKSYCAAIGEELFTVGMIHNQDLYFGQSDFIYELSDPDQDNNPISIQKLNLETGEITEIWIGNGRKYGAYPMYPGTTVHVLKYDQNKNRFLFYVEGVHSDDFSKSYYFFDLVTNEKEFLYSIYGGIGYSAVLLDEPM